MATSRRDFLKTAAGVSGAVGLTSSAPRTVLGTTETELESSRLVPSQKAPRPLGLLILGGTGFIGPHEVRYAVSRGHKVTVFNRGRRQTSLPTEVEHLQGDRNGQLDALKGRAWDVCIDNPTTLPKWVRDAAAILKGNVRRYVFISTISVYAHYKHAGMDEDSELAQYKGRDAFAEPLENAGKLYGPLKVLSEKEAEKGFPGRVTVIRPGLIVGPGDETDRFTYWPVRIARGGEVLAPGSPSDPVQIIDVRDLSEFIIHMCEQGEVGTYNATGPRAPLSIAEELHGCRAVVSGSADVRFTWAPADFLAEQGVRPWIEMPTWLPNRGDNDGWSRLSIARALGKGLTFRALATTARDTLEWWKGLPDDRRAQPKAGLAPEKELSVLAAWHAREKKARQ